MSSPRSRGHKPPQAISPLHAGLSRRALRDAGLAVENPAPPDLAFANLPGVDPKMSLAARTLVAEIEAMAGNVDAALKTVRSDDEKGYRQFAFQRVVSARAIAGDVTVRRGSASTSAKHLKSDFRPSKDSDRVSKLGSRSKCSSLGHGRGDRKSRFAADLPCEKEAEWLGSKKTILG